jgi:hypothetical protein
LVSKSSSSLLSLSVSVRRVTTSVRPIEALTCKWILHLHAMNVLTMAECACRSCRSEGIWGSTLESKRKGCNVQTGRYHHISDVGSCITLRSIGELPLEAVFSKGGQTQLRHCLICASGKTGLRQVFARQACLCNRTQGNELQMLVAARMNQF